MNVLGMQLWMNALLIFFQAYFITQFQHERGKEEEGKGYVIQVPRRTIISHHLNSTPQNQQVCGWCWRRENNQCEGRCEIVKQLEQKHLSIFYFIYYIPFIAESKRVFPFSCLDEK